MPTIDQLDTYLTTPGADDLIHLRAKEGGSTYLSRKARRADLAASAALPGLVELATAAETQTGTDAARAVTPAGLKEYFNQPIPIGTSGILKFAMETRPEFFQMYGTETVFSGVQDPLVYWGFNVNGVGGRLDALLPAIYQQFEADYYVSLKHIQEWSFNTYATDGSGAKRWMAFASNVADYTEAYWQFWLGTTGSSYFLVSDVVGGGDLFLVDPINSRIVNRLNTSIIGNLEITDIALLGTSTSQLGIRRSVAPTTTYYAVQIIPTIAPTVSITTSALYLSPIFNTPAAVAFNTIRGAWFGAPDITLGGGGATLAYAYTVDIGGAPTEALYGNWALKVSGNAVYENNVLFAGSVADAPTTAVDINDDILRLRTAKTPATAGASGNQGDICWDASNIYVCVATNTWKKIGIATW